MNELRVPDALFSSNNHLEIPSLLLDYQGRYVDLPVRGWGSVSRPTRMRGTWHFFVDDYKFTALWKHPESVLKTKAYNCVEANYTTDDQMPLAVGAYRIYQKRWLARFWQEHGMGIFVDLNVAQKFEEINFLGVPLGWRSYATSATSSDLPLLEHQVKLALENSGTDINLLVYGGGEEVKQYCGWMGFVHIPEARGQAKVKNG